MKILLVDDNKYILNSLQRGIDYERLGFDQVFTARSLKGAVKILEKEPIQAVVTDIEMPNGSGLDLLEWINAHLPDIVTIFCTSYADFNYARRALELHSFDYYLKPIDFEHLYHILERVVAEIRSREAENIQKTLGRYWTDQQDENKNYFWLEILIRNYGYAEDELEEFAASRHLDYHYDDSYLMGVLQLNGDMVEMRYSDRQFVISNILRELFSKKQMRVEALIGEHENRWLIVAQDLQSREDEGALADMKAIFSDLKDCLKCRMNFLYERNIPLKDMRGVYLDLEQGLKVLKTSQEDICVPLEPSKLEEISEDSERALEQLKAYLEEHFNEKISQDQMAEQVYYNLNYISKLFKRKYGMSIGNYIMEYRIETAKELLRQDKLSVTEIALQVGYGNFAYFSRLFKKKTGYAPVEYRKQMKPTK